MRKLFTSARLGGFLKIFLRNLRKGVDKRYTKYTNSTVCFCAKGRIERKCKIYLDFVVTMWYNKEGGKESHFVKERKEVNKMKRQEKYPSTKTFHYYNANPKGRITGDCVTRALCTALEIPYNQCVMEQAEVQCKTGYDNATAQGIEYYVKQKGWVKHSQPRKADGTKYTGEEWCEKLTKDGWYKGKAIVANIGGHHTVCIREVDGKFKVHDHWNSTYGCIGNWWTKA